MSLIVSSTTDTQEQVNAAAGIEAPAVEAPEDARHPETAPPKQAPVLEPPEPDTEEEEGEGEEEEKPEEEDAAKPKKLGGWQRKIDKLQKALEHQTRQSELMAQRNQELDYYLRRQNGQQPPQQQQQQGDPEPRQDAYESYEKYIKDQIRWEMRQEIAQHNAAYQRQVQEQQKYEIEQGWAQRAGQFRAQNPDFDAVMSQTGHINFSSALLDAIKQDDMGPQLAYELARNPELLQKLANVPPAVAPVALGQLKAEMMAKQAPPRTEKRPVSLAPAPIRPVGQGASGNSTVPLDQTDYRTYKRIREMQIAKARENR